MTTDDFTEAERAIRNNKRLDPHLIRDMTVGEKA